MRKCPSIRKLPSFLCLLYTFLFSSFVCLVFSFVLLPARVLEVFLAIVPKILVISFTLSRAYLCTHCKDGFVATNSPTSSLTQNHLVSAFISNDSFAGYKNHCGRCFGLRACSTSLQALLEMKVFDQRSVVFWMFLIYSSSLYFVRRVLTCSFYTELFYLDHKHVIYTIYVTNVMYVISMSCMSHMSYMCPI